MGRTTRRTNEDPPRVCNSGRTIYFECHFIQLSPVQCHSVLSFGDLLPLSTIFSRARDRRGVSLRGKMPRNGLSFRTRHWLSISSFASMTIYLPAGPASYAVRATLPGIHYRRCSAQRESAQSKDRTNGSAVTRGPVTRSSLYLVDY